MKAKKFKSVCPLFGARWIQVVVFFIATPGLSIVTTAQVPVPPTQSSQFKEAFKKVQNFNSQIMAFNQIQDLYLDFSAGLKSARDSDNAVDLSPAIDLNGDQLVSIRDYSLAELQRLEAIVIRYFAWQELLDYRRSSTPDTRIAAPLFLDADVLGAGTVQSAHYLKSVRVEKIKPDEHDFWAIPLKTDSPSVSPEVIVNYLQDGLKKEVGGVSLPQRDRHFLNFFKLWLLESHGFSDFLAHRKLEELNLRNLHSRLLNLPEQEFSPYFEAFAGLIRNSGAPLAVKDELLSAWTAIADKVKNVSPLGEIQNAAIFRVIDVRGVADLNPGFLNSRRDWFAWLAGHDLLLKGLSVDLLDINQSGKINQTDVEVLVRWFHSADAFCELFASFEFCSGYLKLRNPNTQVASEQIEDTQKLHEFLIEELKTEVLMEVIRHGLPRESPLKSIDNLSWAEHLRRWEGYRRKADFFEEIQGLPDSDLKQFLKESITEKLFSAADWELNKPQIALNPSIVAEYGEILKRHQGVVPTQSNAVTDVDRSDAARFVEVQRLILESNASSRMGALLRSVHADNPTVDLFYRMVEQIRSYEMLLSRFDLNQNTSLDYLDIRLLEGLNLIERNYNLKR